VVEEASVVAATDSKILITGESGVGKELLARFIHERSPRSRRPMLTINCAGVPETLLESELFGHMRGSFTDAHRDRRGLLELADGGTIMLDEVGEMSLRMQTMLLRFLESGEIQQIGSERLKRTVDVRVISATNRDLLERTKQKEFREDLYYRLNIVHLVVPPLRARREDIRLLLDHYLRVMSERHRLPLCELSSDAIVHLEDYHWPGNIRELRNVAERIALRFSGRTVTMADLPGQLSREQIRMPEAVVPNAAEALATACFDRMINNGESFWTVVYEPFMLRDLTRETVRAVVRMGLDRARGSYRIVSQLFNMPPNDYKRFLTFLQKYECHLPFQRFRLVSHSRERAAGTAAAPADVARKSDAAKAL
jgi:transcriptional regulator with GAF, ATPase, and Fis domain